MLWVVEDRRFRATALAAGGNVRPRAAFGHMMMKLFPHSWMCSTRRVVFGLSAYLVLSLGLAMPAAAQPGRAALKPLDSEDWDRGAARHLLRRAGFGGTPDEVDALYRLGLDGAVDRLVNFDVLPFACPEPHFDPLVLERYDRAALRGLPESERQALQQLRQRRERAAHAETRTWWLDRMLTTPRPLEEKMTLFWHGHFTSGAREVRRALYMKEQNDLLRRLCVGRFHDLLRGISRDPAMLVYLDNARSRATQPNENFARELLELFTLGVGNYRENDIRAAARAFTGWSLDDDEFRFRRFIHDSGRKTFLGETGAWGGDDILRIILKQPACARFLARKLLEHFVRPEPEAALVEALAGELRRRDYHLRPVLATLFRSQAFYQPASRGALVKSPVELLVMASREFGHPLTNLSAAERAAARMGQELMQPPSVKGWDGGARWINTATLFTRYESVGALLNGVAPPRRRAAANDEEAEPDAGGAMAAAATRSRVVGQRQAAYDPLPELTRRRLRTADEIVDYYVHEYLAVPLSEEKRAALVDFLRDGSFFDLGAPRAADRLRLVLHLLCSTPEYQMY
jgi:uncharacterized protein (DUF1800 family)